MPLKHEHLIVQSTILGPIRVIDLLEPFWPVASSWKFLDRDGSIKERTAGHVTWPTMDGDLRCIEERSLPA